MHTHTHTYDSKVHTHTVRYSTHSCIHVGCTGVHDLEVAGAPPSMGSEAAQKHDEEKLAFVAIAHKSHRHIDRLVPPIDSGKTCLAEGCHTEWRL